MTKKRQKRLKPITLNEFKAWLEGVEELQPEGWAPDASQWELIRNKINSIKLDVAKKDAKQGKTNPFEQAPANEQQNFAPPPMNPLDVAGPQSIIDNVPQNAPPLQSSIPANVEISDAARQVMNGNTPLTPGADGKIHTPNIDTLDGNYNSTFE